MSPEHIQFAVILIITFIVSTVTLLTGFGVGTVLTPVVAFVYDIKTAVLLVAVVHLANSLLKFGLFRTSIDKGIFKRFGLISLVGALVGSFLQAILQPSWIAVVLGLFLLASGITEFLPANRAYRIPKQFDIAGGFFSGLMGGVIGNQGAVRSAYLLNYGLSKEAFIATATAIAVVIDLARIPVYLYGQSAHVSQHAGTFGLVIVAAFAGTLTGRELLKKLSLEKFRRLVAAFLILTGIYLMIRS